MELGYGLGLGFGFGFGLGLGLGLGLDSGSGLELGNLVDLGPVGVDAVARVGPHQLGGEDGLLVQVLAEGGRLLRRESPPPPAIPLVVERAELRHIVGRQRGHLVGVRAS